MEDKKGVKIAKLEGALDFVEWRRMIKAYLRRDDYLLLGLEKSAEDDTQQAIAAWRKAQIIAKSNIVLHLGSQPQVRCRGIIDNDDKTAYDLWKALEETYTATNSQAIQNLRHQLDSLLYKDGGDWDEHFSKFMGILAQLASLDEEISEKEKTSRLIRSLPQSFSPIAMVGNLLDSFEKLEQAVRAEVDRRKNPHNPQSSNFNNDSQAKPKANFTSNKDNHASRKPNKFTKQFHKGDQEEKREM